MRIVAAVLAAGSGTRFGADKVWLPLKGRPVWRWSADSLVSHPLIDRVLLVVHPSRMGDFLIPGVEVIGGGNSRQESSLLALQSAGDADYLLVHDAARPFLDAELIDRLVAEVVQYGAVGAGLPVTDTIKRVKERQVEETIDRTTLWAMQTPQIARTDWLREAHAMDLPESTDELGLLESGGFPTRIVLGSQNGFKITTGPDYERAKMRVEFPETRTGLGYDIHAFSEDPTRTLMLGGVAFPGDRALEGHSDADVLLHAITDAILGGIANGDIGVHFSNTDPRWKGCSSIVFLEHAVKLAREVGWELLHIDATMIAEEPKVMKKALEIRETISNACGLTVDRVSIKATTNEKLGSLGRSEGIAAYAVASLRR